MWKGFPKLWRNNARGAFQLQREDSPVVGGGAGMRARVPGNELKTYMPVVLPCIR